MADLKSELLRIIEHKLLFPIFQPIVSVNQKQIIGYQALVRGPSDSPLHSPLNLFDAAEHHRQLGHLELICHEACINSFTHLKIPGKLFLKARPSVLRDPECKKPKTQKFIKKSGLDLHSIIIELSEQHITDDRQILQEAAEHYRDAGFKIAIDHLGAQHFGLRFLSELQPEYIKIDKHYVQGLDEDEIKLNIVRSIQNMATAMNSKVIAVGVETPDEFQAILKTGVTHAQGFYFARPVPYPLTELDEKQFVRALQFENQQGSLHSKKVAIIAKFVSPIPADKLVDKVLDIFQHQQQLNIIPVVENGVAIGLIVRDRFLSKLFSSRYGIELYGKHPIKSFINDTPISFDKNLGIEQVSKQLTAAMRSDQAFLITDEGAYFGIATILDLLEEITQQQINNAKHANPLTLLPGSVYINDFINMLLAEQKPFGVGYFDLDNFKPYNDIYGYSAGDSIIKAVAETLAQYINPEAGHVGHIGGDDFIVIFTSDHWLADCQNILATFQKLVPDHYKAEDVQAGGIQSEDRHGQKHFFPLISLSVGLVDFEAAQQCKSHVDIADLATEAKKQAKKLAGNSFFINRRVQNQALITTFNRDRSDINKSCLLSEARAD